MQKQFVTYDMAKRLEVLGFNEYCWAEYAKHAKTGDIILRDPWLGLHPDWPFMTDVAAPLWQQVTTWLREAQGIHISIDAYTFTTPSSFQYGYKITTEMATEQRGGYNNYHECLNDAVLAALSIVD